MTVPGDVHCAQDDCERVEGCVFVMGDPGWVAGAHSVTL